MTCILICRIYLLGVEPLRIESHMEMEMEIFGSVCILCFVDFLFDVCFDVDV